MKWRDISNGVRSVFGKRVEDSDAMTPKEVFDNARYVEFSNDGLVVCVWSGGHAVNVYSVVQMKYGVVFMEMSVFHVGDISTGETSVQDAQEGIEILFETREKHGD